jgi:hypothetical protein
MVTKAGCFSGTLGFKTVQYPAWERGGGIKFWLSFSWQLHNSLNQAGISIKSV